MKDEPRKQSGGGLSVKTLLIAAAASAIAALVVPMFWEPGTVFAAAMTPIIITVAQELLRKPADTVSAVKARRATGGAVVSEEPFDPLGAHPTEELEALPQTTSQRTVARRRRLTRRQWRLAVVTGLVAFACAVFVLTAAELLAGEQVGGGGNSTTFFSGRDRDPTPTPTATATPEADETPTPTETATPTPSATPTPTGTPAPTVTPGPQATAEPQSEAPAASPTPAP